MVVEVLLLPLALFSLRLTVLTRITSSLTMERLSLLELMIVSKLPMVRKRPLSP